LDLFLECFCYSILPYYLLHLYITIMGKETNLQKVNRLFTKAVKDWVDSHPGVDCKGEDRKTLRRLFGKLSLDLVNKVKTDQQCENKVWYCLSQLRPVLCANKTGRGKRKAENGDTGFRGAEYSAAYKADHLEEVTAYQANYRPAHLEESAAYRADHAVERAAYQAGYNAAHAVERAAYHAAHAVERAAYQAARRAVKRLENRKKNLAYIRKHPELRTSEPKSDEECHDIADAIYDQPRPELDDKSFARAMIWDEIALYAGLTFRQWRDEWLRWLTARGFNNSRNGRRYNGQRNRPVLLDRNGRPIKMKSAEDDLGFKGKSMTLTH